MSVHTGFGGQPFIAEVLDKVRAARKVIDADGLAVEIEIDGGIKVDNAALAAAAGVDILVSGTGIFGADDPAAAATRDPRRRVVAMQAKVLTVSDGVAEGSRDDKSGRALAERLTAAGYDVVDHRVCADGVDTVGAALREMTDGFAGLVVTTGGTGFGPRDLTPEGTRAVIEREAPGIAEAIRRASDGDGRGFGMLSAASRARGAGADLQPAGLVERRGRGLRRARADRRPRARPPRRRPPALNGPLRWTRRRRSPQSAANSSRSFRSCRRTGTAMVIGSYAIREGSASACAP